MTSTRTIVAIDGAASQVNRQAHQGKAAFPDDSIRRGEEHRRAALGDGRRDASAPASRSIQQQGIYLSHGVK